MMSTKFLIVLTWIFYTGLRRSGDDIWFFCTLVSGLSTACAFFYRLENKPARQPTKSKK